MITAALWDKLRLLAVVDSTGKRRHWPNIETARAELTQESPRELHYFFEVEPITLAAYWDALNRADWYYEMSDDGATYSRGSAEIGTLECQALWSAEHAALFDSFQAHYWAPVDERDKVAPKPVRPAD